MCIYFITVSIYAVDFLMDISYAFSIYGFEGKGTFLRRTVKTVPKYYQLVNLPFLQGQ